MCIYMHLLQTSLGVGPSTTFGSYKEPGEPLGVQICHKSLLDICAVQQVRGNIEFCALCQPFQQTPQYDTAACV